MFLATLLFRVAKNCKASQCPATGRWINQCGDGDTIDDYSTTERNHITCIKYAG